MMLAFTLPVALLATRNSNHDHHWTEQPMGCGGEQEGRNHRCREWCTSVASQSIVIQERSRGHLGQRGVDKGSSVGLVVWQWQHLVADTSNNRIQKFTADGTFITAVGSEGKKLLQFDLPTGIAIHPGKGQFRYLRGIALILIVSIT